MDLPVRYLSLLKKSLLDELYIENEARLTYFVLALATRTPVDEATVRDIATRRPDILTKLREARQEGLNSFNWNVTMPDGRAGVVNISNFTEVYHTMIGRARLENLHHLLDRITEDHIPGDLLEAGVWRGGASIFMRGYLAAYGITSRTVWAADSFAGLPVPSLPPDAKFNMSAAIFPILAIKRKDVEELFQRYDLLDERVQFLEGWFRDSLPSAPIERLALLRLDGDLYESTRDALLPLYDKLSSGGYVIVDDYNDLPPCKSAVDEFRKDRGITAPIVRIDQNGVYWRKD